MAEPLSQQTLELTIRKETMTRTTTSLPFATESFCQEAVVSLELFHKGLGHRKCRTLLAANKHQLWEDVEVQMLQELVCLSCDIATIKSPACNKEHLTGATSLESMSFGHLASYHTHWTHSKH
jgi:hypothetical protein